VSTTGLFVELLVIGFGTLTWIVLIGMSWFGLGWALHAVAAVQSATALSTLGILAIAYVIGIIADEFCDKLTEPLEIAIQSSVRKSGNPEM
jgi:hypothetical protein